MDREKVPIRDYVPDLRKLLKSTGMTAAGLCSGKLTCPWNGKQHLLHYKKNYREDVPDGRSPA